MLLLTGSLGPGGTELAVMTLARALAARGRVEPRVAVLGEGGYWAEGLRADGIPTEELRLRGPLRRPSALAKLYTLTKLVRDARIDIVQTFLFDADVYGMLAARWGAPRAIITTRRAIKANRPHHLRGYRMTNRFVDRIVANSEAVRRFTLDLERAPAEKVLVIPNGAELSRFRTGDRAAFRRAHGVLEGEVLVGAVGTIKPVKGQRVLVEAMLPLLEGCDRVRLVLAGEVTPGYGDEIRALLAAREAGARVLLPGVVDDVPGLLAALDVFVLPSLSEGMSNALIEAMAAGKAIVATNAGGNAECLAEGACGLVVPAGDAGALSRAIEALLDDAPRRMALGSAASVRAEREYALETMVGRYEALYEQVLEAAS